MEENITPGQIGKKYGLIYGLVATLVAVAPLILDATVPFGWLLNIVIAFVMFALAGKEFKSLNGGLMTFGQGFKINIIAAAIAGAMRGLVNYIYVKFVDTTVMDRAWEAIQEQWEAQGVDPDQMGAMANITKQMLVPEVGLLVGIVVMMLGGLIWGAITAAIVKKEEEEF